VHEQSIRFRQTSKWPLRLISNLLTETVAKLSETLASEVSQVIKETFTAPAVDADLKAFNDSFLHKHPESASHLQAAYNVRHILDSTTKSQNEQDLIKVLDLSDVTIQQALAGFGLLEEWKSEKQVKDDYRAKAASRWSDATVFKQ